MAFTGLSLEVCHAKFRILVKKTFVPLFLSPIPALDPIASSERQGFPISGSEDRCFLSSF